MMTRDSDSGRVVHAIGGHLTRIHEFIYAPDTVLEDRIGTIRHLVYGQTKEGAIGQLPYVQSTYSGQGFAYQQELPCISCNKPGQ